jgi:hypothetical protein
MHLTVLEGNTDAAGFYESRGWCFDGRAVDTMGSFAVDLLKYVLPLASAARGG